MWGRGASALQGHAQRHKLLIWASAAVIGVGGVAAVTSAPAWPTSSSPDGAGDRPPRLTVRARARSGTLACGCSHLLHRCVGLPSARSRAAAVGATRAVGSCSAAARPPFTLRHAPLLPPPPPPPPQERAWQSASRAAGAGERSARDTLARTLAAVDALAAEGTAAAMAMAARLVASWAEDEDAREAVVAVGARARARASASPRTRARRHRP